jgi:hypothetical protein
MPENGIFTVALQPVDEEFSHPFGGIVQGIQGYDVIRFGFNYGGRGGFSDDHTINENATARQIVLLPASAASVQRYEHTVTSFRALHKYNRLPYYLSARFRINPLFEDPNNSPVYLDGTPTPFPDPYGIKYRREMYDPFGMKETDLALLKPPYLQRIRANCLTLFNLSANLSGIDLKRLHPDWFSFRRGMQAERCLADLCKNSRLVETIDQNDVYVSQDKQPPYVAPQVKYNVQVFNTGGSSCIAVAADVQPKERVRFYTFVHAAAMAYGGFQALQDHMGALPPWESDPLPVPAYLQTELYRVAMLSLEPVV